MPDEFETYRTLMKEATKYKKIDISKSIDIIRKAINVCPGCAKYDGNFRLVKYLTIAKRHEEVRTEYQLLLQQIDLQFDGEPFSSHCTIFGSMSEYYCKENDFEKGFFYAVLSYWNAVVRTAFAGQENHLDYLLSDKYVFPTIHNLIIKLKTVNAEEVLESIPKVIRTFFNELKTITELYNRIESSDTFLEPPFYKKESYSFRLARLLNNNCEYQKCKQILKEINFEQEYNVKIKPILKLSSCPQTNFDQRFLICTNRS